jgi:hypothetical protein
MSAAPINAGGSRVMGPLIPPVVAVLGLVAAIVFGAAYSYAEIEDLISWDFVLLRGPELFAIVTYGESDPLIPVWGVAVPSVVMVLATALMASRTTGGFGGRLLVGFLVGPVLAILAAIAALVGLASLDLFEVADTGEFVGRAAGAAFGAGAISGMLGAVLSIAIRRP